MEAQARRAGGGGGDALPPPQPAPAPRENDDDGADAADDKAQPPPEARVLAAHPRAAEVLRELEDASRGLLVISESDEPFLPFDWPDVGPFSPAALAARYGGGGGGGGGDGDAGSDDDDGGGGGGDGDGDSEEEAEATPAFTVEPVALWFDRAARAAEAARRPDEAARMRALCALVRRRLAGAAAVRVGAVGRIAVYLVGAVRDEEEAGLGEYEEEEQGDLGVYPPGATIVGLETVQVET